MNCLVVLTLQQIVLSKNLDTPRVFVNTVLTLQQIVLSKNSIFARRIWTPCFDFTTNCSF